MVPTALHEAVEQGRVERVRTLSSLHPGWLTVHDPNGGYTALHTAAHFGQAECVHALLEAGTPIDARTWVGFTPLLVASWEGHAECVRILLAAGADILAVDEFFLGADHTAMHMAAHQRHVATLCVLLDGAKESGLLPAALQALDVDRCTPFLVAAARGSTACMAALLSSGSGIKEAVPAGIWIQGGATALHLAAKEGHVEAVQLIAALAPELAAVRAAGGMTPLDLARQHNHLEAGRCLEGPVPTAAVLSILANAGPPALPLCAQLLATRWPLSDEEWELVPAPCPGLGTLLPRAVGETGEQAVLVVRHLPQADHERLRASAASLALGRDRHNMPLPRLPVDVARCILALSLA